MNSCHASFRSYVLSRKTRDSLVGDFIGDAQRDRTFPDVATWPELRGYLWQRDACEGAFEAARIVWRCWQSYQKRHH
jgi:hypothetical protein